MDKKIIMLATGAGAGECPRDGRVWSANGGYKLRKLSRLFLTDKLYTEYDEPNFDVDEMNELGIPVVSRNHIEGLNYEPYPFEEIVKHFETDYFANSFCYMFAYALYHGIRDFQCYGFQFSTPREVIEQKPCLEYWVGRALGMGAKVKIHGDTTLLKHYRGLPYGFDGGEYEYKVDKWGALEKWHNVVEEAHWAFFPAGISSGRENDVV